MALTNAEKQAAFKERQFKAGEIRVESWLNSNVLNAGENDYSDGRELSAALEKLLKAKENGKIREEVYLYAVELWKPILGKRLYDSWRIIK